MEVVGQPGDDKRCCTAEQGQIYVVGDGKGRTADVRRKDFREDAGQRADVQGEQDEEDRFSRQKGSRCASVKFPVEERGKQEKSRRGDQGHGFSPEPVRQVSRKRDEEQEREKSQNLDGQGPFECAAGKTREKRRLIDDDRVERDRIGDQKSESFGHFPSVSAKCRDQRGSIPFFRPESGRFGKMPTQEKTGSRQDDSRQEGDAPAPGREPVGAQGQGDGERRQRSQKDAGDYSHQRPGAVVSSFMKGCCFHKKRHDEGELPSDGQPLQDAEDHQKGGRQEPGLLIGWQKSDQRGGDGHQKNREDQRAFSSPGVSGVTEEYPADGPADISRGEGPEGFQEGQVTVSRRKEYPGEQGGETPVKGEIVPFQHVADDVGGENPAGGKSLFQRSGFGHVFPASGGRMSLGEVLLFQRDEEMPFPDSCRSRPPGKGQGPGRGLSERKVRMKFRWILFVTAMSFFLPSVCPSVSGATERSDAIRLAKKAENGDAAARGTLAGMARAGDVWAEIVYGDLIARGKGTKPDPARALVWYRKAAEAGNPVAETNMGAAYYFGQGVSDDYVEAAGWFRKAARQRFPAAENWMGSLRAAGLGVRRDPSRAFFWYEKAARHGEPGGMTNLGEAYMEGVGTPRLPEKGVFWLRKAARLGDAEAEAMLGSAYKYGQGVPRSFSRAVDWFRKGARGGDAMAAYGLGICYARGQGVSSDPVRGYAWLTVAQAMSRTGSPTAGIIARERGYLKRRMTPEDLSRAEGLAGDLLRRFSLKSERLAG